MSDYTELVKALRCCATMTCKGDECKYMILGCHDCFPKLHNDAAAAIEALQAEVNRLELDNEDYEYTLRDRYDEPKRGEWISDRLVTTKGGTYGVRRCSACEAYYQDVGYGWNYCPNCGAKMEVRDGANRGF